MKFGNPAQLGFEFIKDEDHQLSHLAWGKLRVFLNGRELWLGEDQSPVSWTWLDVAEWLASSWRFILYESSYPAGLSPSHPKLLDDERWIANQRLKENLDDDFFRFQARHDLSYGLKGMFMPSIWFIPEEDQIRIHGLHPSNVAWVPKAEFVNIMESLVECIFSHARKDTTGRLAHAKSRWGNREPDQDTIARISTGLTLREITEMASQVPTVEIMAAARLSVALPKDVRSTIFQCVVGLEKRETDDLDRLTEESKSIIAALSGMPPHEQGYRLALWLREFHFPLSKRTNPRELIVDWNVQIKSVDLGSDRLDAVACWGPNHGPAVIINTAGKHTRSPQALRATFAHEMAHLIFDRGRNLPFGEILGGNVPAHIEKRARAFAAEFLVPRHVVEDVLLSASFDVASKMLKETYVVSNELLGWQITNSNAYSALNEVDKKKVDRWTKVEKADSKFGQ